MPPLKRQESKLTLAGFELRILLIKYFVHSFCIPHSTALLITVSAICIRFEILGTGWGLVDCMGPSVLDWYFIFIESGDNERQNNLQQDLNLEEVDIVYHPWRRGGGQ